MYVSRMDCQMGMMVRGCYVDAVCYLAEGFLQLIVTGIDDGEWIGVGGDRCCSQHQRRKKIA